MGYAIRYVRGDLVVMNQMDTEKQLENRFPNYRSKECTEFEGLSAIVLSHEHTVQKYPCYAYGYQIGDDISHTFHTQLLIITLAESAKFDVGGFVLVRINGYSNYSERYDQDSVTVSCELGTGETMDIESHYYYEKYGGQSHDSKTPLAPLLDYMQKHLGLIDLNEQRLSNWFYKMRKRFSY